MTSTLSPATAEAASTAPPGPAQPATHLAPLGKSGWSVWTDVALRSAGFPASRLDPICDAELARAADRSRESEQDAEHYRAVYREATARLSEAVRAAASEPRFREAVAWQNPDLIRNCLDKAARGEPRNVRGRNHELTIVSYLQRYAYKNDTVGFTGPVGWASVQPTQPRLRVTPGSSLLRRRTTYFEVWAIDELATRMAAREDMLPWLVARADWTGGRANRLVRAPETLSAEQDRLIARCDGTRTVRDLTREAGPDGADRALAALLELRQLGIVRLDLLGPMHAWPERLLQKRLERIEDPVLRAAMLGMLEELVDARDAVDDAAGDADKVIVATEELGRVFTRLSSSAASRRPGSTYAGRTLIYQDTVRDVEVQLGQPVIDALAGPLSLVLDSTRWLAGIMAQRYEDLFLRLHAQHARSSPTGTVRLAQLLLAATPHMPTLERHHMPPLAAEALAELQYRWQCLLEVPAGARRHHVALADVADLSAALFPPVAPRWANARQHSPDLMIAARDADAINRGEYQFVLGEIHLAMNTLESRLFVEQHEDPARLLAAAEADAAGRRIYAVQRKSSPGVTSRVSPPTALLSPEFVYWTIGDEAVDCPTAPIVVTDLDVVREDDHLLVQSRTDGRQFDFLEVIGEILTTLVIDALQPLPAAAHQPRVCIDRMVLCRESWTVATTDIGWAFLADECARFAAARAWIAERGIPDRCFSKVPVEEKPTLVDFTSLPLVNLFAKAVRRTAEEGLETVRLSECLPAPDDLWLVDGEGQHYTSELRMVAVDTAFAADR